MNSSHHRPFNLGEDLSLMLPEMYRGIETPMYARAERHASRPNLLYNSELDPTLLSAIEHAEDLAEFGDPWEQNIAIMHLNCGDLAVVDRKIDYTSGTEHDTTFHFTLLNDRLQSETFHASIDTNGKFKGSIPELFDFITLATVRFGTADELSKNEQTPLAPHRGAVFANVHRLLRSQDKNTVLQGTYDAEILSKSREQLVPEGLGDINITGRRYVAANAIDDRIIVDNTEFFAITPSLEDTERILAELAGGPLIELSVLLHQPAHDPSDNDDIMKLTVDKNQNVSFLDNNSDCSSDDNLILIEYLRTLCELEEQAKENLDPEHIYPPSSLVLATEIDDMLGGVLADLPARIEAQYLEQNAIFELSDVAVEGDDPEAEKLTLSIRHNAATSMMSYELLWTMNSEILLAGIIHDDDVFDIITEPTKTLEDIDDYEPNGNLVGPLADLYQCLKQITAGTNEETIANARGLIKHVLALEARENIARHELLEYRGELNGHPYLLRLRKQISPSASLDYLSATTDEIDDWEDEHMQIQNDYKPSVLFTFFDADSDQFVTLFGDNVFEDDGERLTRHYSMHIDDTFIMHDSHACHYEEVTEDPWEHTLTRPVLETIRSNALKILADLLAEIDAEAKNLATDLDSELSKLLNQGEA